LKCRRVQDLIAPYLDNRLTGQQMLEIQAHLDTCSECAQEFQLVRQVRAVLRSMSARNPGIAMEARLLSRIAQESEQGTNRSFVTVTPRAQRTRRLASALALSCLGFFSAAPLFAPPSSQMATSRTSVAGNFMSGPFIPQPSQTILQPTGVVPSKISSFLFGPSLSAMSISHDRSAMRTDNYGRLSVMPLQQYSSTNWNEPRFSRDISGSNMVLTGYVSH